MSDRPTPETDAHIKELQRNPEISGCNQTLNFVRKLERERNEALLQLGAIQSAFAEELDLSFTPTAPDEMRQALRSLVACGTALAKAIGEGAK
jgi:hypothetical protein